jgi:DNA repair protein RecN (Recombination protein N)
MLTELVIRNFATIDRLQVSFGPGFNVLTGETGAGKSIVLDAVGLLLGDRARPDLIRTGEEEATVEALFDLSQRSDLRQMVAEAGFEESEELLVRRVVSRSGKNRIFINGSMAKLGQLQPIVSRLTTIYGQHEHQRLQRTETHLSLLDQFAGAHEELETYRRFYREAADLADRLQFLEESETERRQRLDLLSYQSREIEAARLCAEEDEELAAERKLLQNAEQLAAATGGGFDKLYGDEGAVCEILETVASSLEEMAGIDAKLGSLAEAVRASLYSLEDVAGELRDYAGQLAFEPHRQEQVEERLAQIAALKRKYAPTIAEIFAFKARIDEEIDELTNLDDTREALRSRIASIKERLLQSGSALSTRRLKAAHVLREAVEGELKGLALEKASFEVRFFEHSEPGPSGLERGEFYLAPNPGEEPKPLAWIASGGELSRIMLALRRVAPEAEGIPTLIFDEVDAGISGVAATAVGEKLRGVARSAQILCVTHLPQVAAFGDRHYRVEKREKEGRTFTDVQLLAEEERVLEMARLLGGARVTDRTLDHAREIIAHSEAG